MDSFSSCASHHKPFVHRMAAVNRCNVAFMVYDGSCHRQLSTFQSVELREQFENFVISIQVGASKFGDWYKFANLNQNHSAVGKTWELGGICYDLPFRTRKVRGFCISYKIVTAVGDLPISPLFSLKPLQ